MKHTPLVLAINGTLITVLAGMLMLPMGVVHVLTQSTQTDAQVAGAADGSGDFVVLPNFFDFGSHAQFNPKQNGNQFSDSLTVTAFKGQVATYHTVYTILNKTDRPVVAELLLTDVPEPSEPYEMFLLSFASEGVVHTTTLAQTSSTGDMQLKLQDASVAQGVRYIVIDGEVIPVRAVDGNSVIIDPAVKGFEQGTTVHRAGLLVRDGAVVHANETSVSIGGNSSATVNVVLIGKTDVDSSAVTAPLFMQVRPESLE